MACGVVKLDFIWWTSSTNNAVKVDLTPTLVAPPCTLALLDLPKSSAALSSSPGPDVTMILPGLVVRYPSFKKYVVGIRRFAHGSDEIPAGKRPRLRRDSPTAPTPILLGLELAWEKIVRVILL